MGIVDFDPLAVLPVTAAAASAAYARAVDLNHSADDRRRHLESLERTPASVDRLLDRCQQESARLASELSRPDAAEPCSVA